MYQHLVSLQLIACPGSVPHVESFLKDRYLNRQRCNSEGYVVTVKDISQQ